MERLHSPVPSSVLAIALVALAALGPSAHAAAPLTGPFVNPANGHGYYLLGESTWTDAEATAQALGGDLVTVNDAAENAWVFDTFTPLLSTHPGSTIWLGIQDAGHEGSFTWASGQTASYVNWSPGQPDNARGDENYGMMWTPLSLPQSPEYWGQWNDLANSFPGIAGYGVVEVDSVPVPEPAGAWLLAAGAAMLLCARRLMPWAARPGSSASNG